VARYNSDGSLDTSFGSNGKVTIDFFGDIDEAFGLAIQPDGKIVVVGNAFINTNSLRRLALARLDGDGSLDLSFGSGGKTANRIGEARAVALQPDGKIIVVGDSTFVIPNRDFALARYNFDGSPDSTFGTSGIVTTDFTGLGDYASAVALAADGKIIVAGISIITDIESNFALARYNGDGILDSTFGSGGKLTTDISGNSAQAFGVAVQGDGKIILAGSAESKGDHSFAVARYLRITSPDFALSIAPSKVNVVRGETVKIIVDVNRFAGFTGSVTVIAPDISDIKVKVKPKTTSTTGTRVKFKLTIKGSAARGAHSITFFGRDATGRERSDTLTLMIQ
jgi:uncharacterized delta-60 repeat protein